MEVKQIHTLMNNVTKEIIGDTAIVAEDLSNVVDMGKAIFDATSVDKYVQSLVDHIGKVMFVNRPYEGATPSLYRDAWEYGAVLEKVYTTSLPEAVENKTWDLQHGVSYDPNVYTKPDVAAKFFNKRTTFEVDLSITDRQAKSAFDSATQLNAFLSMLVTDVEKSINIKMDGLAQRTINNMIAHTMYAEFPTVSDGDYSAVTGNKAVNLLKLYNDKFNASLTPESCLYNPEFIRFAVLTISVYQSRLKRPSKLFNVGEMVRFTSADMTNLILLSDFKKAADVYLQSDTFNKEYTALPNSDDVPYWQGSGTDYSFSNISDIHVNIEDPETPTSTIEIAASGILGVCFDRYACGITNLDRRVTTNYNPKGEFTNNFFKNDAGSFGDLNESFVVFFVA